MLRRWLGAIGLGRRELVCWAAYDWANSAFYTTIVAAIFPIYFTSVACDGDPAALDRYTWVTSISIAASAVLGPLLGAIADVRACKRLLLGLFTGLGVVATCGLFGVGRGEWVEAALLFGVANFAVAAAFVFYDALLPHVARKDELDRVSTAAYALGYLGGGLLLAAQLAWIAAPARFGLPVAKGGEGLTDEQSTLPVRLALLSAGLWWGIFALPTLLGVREPRRALVSAAGRRGRPISTAARQLAETFREIRRYRPAFLMMLAFVLYGDGILTVIRMAAMLGQSKGIPQAELIRALLVVQLVGIPAAFAIGRLAGRFGAKRAILVCLAVYGVVCVLAWRVEGVRGFWALALLVALVQGGTQALSRSLFASLIPAHKSGEFFGLFSVLEKFGGLLGPPFYAAVSAATGSQGLGALSIAIFFGTGALVLAKVDVEAGRAQALPAGVPPAGG